MSDEANKTVAILKENHRECLVQARAYELWLRFLTPIRWITVISGVALPATAGFMLLRGREIFGAGPWVNVSAVLTFVAALIATLHNALHCEPHQTECRRLKQRYAAIAVEFKAALAGDEKALSRKQAALTTRLSELKRNSTEEPPGWFLDKAQRDVPPLSGDKAIDIRR
ncbi:hypothetical protein SAMN05414139_01480 [Burkholderia sp. D7]|nr:hypothetical protein SAMN05414139_01480 [Burkholderia sp. D7]